MTKLQDILFGAEQDSSPAGEVNPTDLRKVYRHFLIVIASAVISAVFTEAVNSVVPALLLHVPPAFAALGLTTLVSPALEYLRRKATDYVNSLDHA